MNASDRIVRPAGPLTATHPVVQWVTREVLPRIRELFDPYRVIVFDPPDRTASVGEHPPGVVIVSARFRGVAMQDRLAIVRAGLAAVSPVRPFCLTPEEFGAIDATPGPVVGAVRGGVCIFAA